MFILLQMEISVGDSGINVHRRGNVLKFDSRYVQSNHDVLSHSDWCDPAN